ncbi:MAG: phosphomannomutase, partial [Methylophilaceae bacterium]
FLDDQYGLPVVQDTTDGLRLTFDSGVIIHLRPSGNAPEFRCYSEASSPEAAEKITHNVLSKIKQLQQST